ncbi:sperm flagellar protein 2-like [Carettochelys insculpta]|uniref:sperm flagellar protein 2-like n=1 Tax=Carettochelys insculpta TaxID=44489 RepID=UPI003EBB5F3C
MVEKTYENTIKTILRFLRQERYSVIHYLADTRNHFKDYLKRPDHKQEFVSQWQADYNSIADDLWEDEETKAELHQRVTDLRDRLWDICENRREEAEQERSDIMNDGWLPDHIGILMNHYFSLIQVEVDRFQDTKRFLHDYYRGMEGKMPTEACREFTRIPLLDIVNVEQSVDQSKSRRIPMVPRRAPSPEISVSKQKNKAIQLKSNKEENSSESVIFNFEVDEKLITDTWQAAVTAISNLVTAEIQSKEAEEEKERQQLEKKEQERQKPSQAAGGKGGGKDSKESKKPPPKVPAKKKGFPSPAPVVEATPIPITPEELKKQELKLKMKQEYFTALEHEEEAAKFRLQLIKTKALAFVEELVMKAEEMYKSMEKWLGAKFLAEMSSVDKLTEVARHHIECSTKIQYELVLDETDFFINKDVKVMPDLIPPPRPPPVETSVNGTLTISQLSTLHKQFLQVAPKGLMSNKAFIDILLDLITLNLGTNSLPDVWMRLTISDLQNLAATLTVNSELIDWRRFLLTAAQPWPIPSVIQLLQTLHSFKAVDEAASGFVTQEYYNQVGLWFNGNEELKIPENPAEPLPFNRLGHLIMFFFILFADARQDPSQLDYTEMLLYFASHPDAVDGVYRALSVATGTYIRRIKEISPSRMSVSQTDTLMKEEEPLVEKEENSYGTDEGRISMATLLRVFHHEGSKAGDNHRFSGQQNADSNNKHFVKIYEELGSEDLKPIPVTLLLKHPFIQDLINNYQGYKLPDIKVILQKDEQTQSTDGEIYKDVKI